MPAIGYIREMKRYGICLQINRTTSHLTFTPWTGDTGNRFGTYHVSPRESVVRMNATLNQIAWIMGIALIASIQMSAAEEPAATYSWQIPYAQATPSGDLVWSPKPFVFHADPQAKYIDYAAGNDENPGTKESPWKHHPWDAAATGRAAAVPGPKPMFSRAG